MLISISSSNPNFSWVIGKNPNSPPLGKSIRKGFSLGWYFSQQTYNLAFFECIRSTGTVSWGKKPDDEFHMLYAGDLVDPVLAISLLNEYFRDLINKQLKEVDLIRTNSITVVSLRINNFAEKIIKHLNLDIEILDYCSQYANYQIVKFSNNGTLKDLFIEVLLYLLFLALHEDKSIDLNKGLIERYISFINKYSIPYYPRSLFKLKIAGLNDPNLINQLNTKNITLSPHDPQRSRIIFTSQSIEPNLNILDFGFGKDWQYGKKLAPKAKQYYGIDKDEDAIENAKKKTQTRGLDNCDFYLSIDDIDENVKIDVIICAEVIEHQEDRNDALKLINELLQRFKPQKLIITTPNKDFNINYMLGESELRHPDHKFELKNEEFIDFLDNLINKNPAYRYNYSGIGDIVSGVFCSQGAVLALNS